MDRKYIVSLVTPKGKMLRDITSFMVSGSVSRVRDNIGGIDLLLSNDVRSLQTFGNAKCWRTWLRCEEQVEGSYDRDIVFEGPVTFRSPDYNNGLDMSGSDMGAYWAKIPVSRSTYPEGDASFLAEVFLKNNLAKNPNSMPVFRVSRSGFVASFEIDNEEGSKFVADYMGELVGLDYCFVGRTLFLFGEELKYKPNIVFSDDSWVEVPSVEEDGGAYANAVFIVGDGVTSYLELDDIDDDIGLLVRRFDLSEVKNQAEADNIAREYLSRVSNLETLNASGGLVLRHDVEVPTNDLVCGVAVEVKSFVSGLERSDRLILDQLDIDLVSGARTLSLVQEVPVDGLEG